VPAERVTLFFSSMLVQPAPPADSRASTIRTDDPSGIHCCVVRQDRVALNSSHHGSPEKLYSCHFRTLHHDAMKIRAPHSQSLSVREPRFHREISADKTNAAEALALDRRDADTESLERNNSVRHQAFATRFIDGRRQAICHRD
jgi:hypothetical protein